MKVYGITLIELWESPEAGIKKWGPRHSSHDVHISLAYSQELDEIPDYTLNDFYYVAMRSNYI